MKGREKVGDREAVVRVVWCGGNEMWNKKFRVSER